MRRLLLRALARTIRGTRAPRPRRVGAAGVALILALVLGLAAPNEWTAQALAAESETAEADGSPSESSASDPVAEACATHARPRFRQARTPARRAPALARRDFRPQRVDARSPRGVAPDRRPIESGRERLTRHQTFLI